MSAVTMTDTFAGADDAPLAGSVSVTRTPTPIAGVAVTRVRSHLLIVEDDVGYARIAAEVLHDAGYATRVATTTEAALEDADRDPPALILLDVHLGAESGFDLAERLASNRRLSSIPIVFVSGASELASKVRGYHKPGWDFLWKPFRIDELMARIERSLADAESRERLRRLAHEDELTGLANSRMLEERMAVETARVLRYRTPLSIVVLDVDGLKRINDSFGHLVGSDVLRAVAHAIAGHTRETDLAARYGGDEFVVLLPHTGFADAVVFAERACQAVRALLPGGVPVTVSVGVDELQLDVDATATDSLRRADAAAYEAKRAGGNRVAAPRLQR